MGLAQSFLKSGDLTLGPKSGLGEALQAAIPAMAKDADRDMRARWFKLLPLLKPRSANGLMRELAATLAKPSSGRAIEVLKSGGVQFLKQGGFNARAGEAVRAVLIPQLAKKEGRAWLKDNRDELHSWVQKADQGAQEELKAALARMLRSGQENRKYTADILTSRWGLQLPK